MLKFRVRPAINSAFALLFTSSLSFSQSYTYVHYDVNNGLAGSTVYSMFHDSQGFIWFGTETGLSRFDGTHFKTFTTSEGLPDNEILKMFEDSKGRIWMLPFRNSICYYFKGKIYNQENDTLLRKMKITARPLNVIEDSMGTIWINESGSIHRVYRNNTVEKINQLGNIKIRNSILLAKDHNNTIWIALTDRKKDMIYSLKSNTTLNIDSAFTSPQNAYSVSKFFRFWRIKVNDFFLYSPKYDTNDTIALNARNLINVSAISDSMVFFNTTEGAIYYNIPGKKTMYTFLPGQIVSNTIIDAEGGLWFSTLGQGVYKLHSENYKSFELRAPGGNKVGVQSIQIKGNSLLLGTIEGQVMQVDSNHVRLIGIIPENIKKRIYYIKSGKNKVIITEHGIFKLNDKFEKIDWIECFTKSVYEYQNSLVIATAWNVIRFNPEKFAISDTLWHERATTAYIDNDSLYVGTLAGLYIVRPDGKIKSMGDEHPLFRKRISAVRKSSDGSLWISTYDNGVVRYKDGHILTHFTMQNGLTSNICRNLYIDSDDVVWVSTSKGISKISGNNNQHVVSKITTADGLLSDIVNNIIVENNIVYAATDEGVSYFNKSKLDQPSICRFHLLSVTINNKPMEISNSYIIRGRNKGIKINFVAISYKSAGDISYRYRIKGLDKAWKETRETTLELVSLPYGSYDLELLGINKFGVKSNPVLIHLTIPVPFWKSTLFYVVCGLVSLGIVIIFFRQRLNAIRKKEIQKTELNKKMAEMELKALRAQMNPHFIFNVLNSIQYFITHNDIHSAERYISRFAKLIRMTLDNSRKLFISLDDELKLLTLYLDLEKMRFEKMFDYKIDVEEGLSTQSVKIPNMLIQPYIENSIKHGFKNMDREAYIDISFFRRENHLVCIISDNGIGRKKAAENSLQDKNDHTPAGITMINEKIEALKAYYNYPVSTVTEDLINTDATVCGTRVVLTLPMKMPDI